VTTAAPDTRGLEAHGLRDQPPVAVDDVRVSAGAAPPDAATLADALRAFVEAGLAVLPRGAGTQTGLGNAPARADAFLSTAALRGVDDFEPAEGVCHARAGTRLAELRAVVNAEGWELPLDDAGRGSTLGGALATATLTPRAQGLGRPRDAVLGCEVALADGTLTRCGGRVVKNVTGYDLARLYTGSLGTLGVVTGAWLRLRPLPETTLALVTPELPAAEACRRGVEWARHGTVRACVLVPAAEDPSDPSDDRARLRGLLELAGDAASVSADREALERDAGAAPTDAADLDAALRDPAPGPDLHFCVSGLATRLADCVETLQRAGAALRVLPGLGLVRARLAAASGDSDDADARASAAFDAVARAAQSAGGRHLCEAAPAAAKRGRDVFAAPPAEVRLTRALKQRFDPRGILNPGRGPGGV